MATLLEHMSTIKNEERRQQDNRDKLDKLKNDYNRFLTYYTDNFTNKFTENINEDFMKSLMTATEKYNHNNVIRNYVTVSTTNYSRTYSISASKQDIYITASDGSKKIYKNGYTIEIKSVYGLDTKDHYYISAYYDPEDSNKFKFCQFTASLYGSKTIENMSKDTNTFTDMKILYSKIDELLEGWREELIRIITDANKVLENQISKCSFDLPWEEANKHGES